MPVRSCDVLIIVLAAVFAGCSPSQGEVKGTIKINGQSPQLAGLEVMFLTANGRMISAPVNADGTYAAAAVPPGEVKIAFVFVPTTGEQPSTKKRILRPGEAGPKPPPPNPIPLSLRDASTSKLSLKVAAGQANVFDYDIKQ